MVIFWYRSLILLFQCNLFLKLQVRTNKLVNSVVYHPCPSRLASGRGTSFHIALNSLGFYLSRMLVEFSLTCVGKMFQFMVFTFLENVLNLCIFTYAPVPHSKLQVEFFENTEQKGSGNYDLL